MKATVVKLVAALTLGLVAAPLTAESQQAGKIYQVGFLHWGNREGSEQQFQAFEQALRERGWVTGENLVITYRYAEGKLDRLPALAGELVRLRAAGYEPTLQGICGERLSRDCANSVTSRAKT